MIGQNRSFLFTGSSERCGIKHFIRKAFEKLGDDRPTGRESPMKRIFKNNSAASAIEYGLMAALVAIAVIGFVATLEPKPNVSGDLLSDRIIAAQVNCD